MTQLIFISYSHKDEEEKEKLLSHLGVLQRDGLIGLWSDDQIGAGDDWEQEMKTAMDQAKVAILLITANFLTSNFNLDKEVPVLLQRRKDEELTVFPVIARACAWKAVDWLANMKVRPRHRRPVWSDAGSHIDEDLTAIAEEVAFIVKNTTRPAPAPDSAPPQSKKTSAKLAPAKKQKNEVVEPIADQSPAGHVLIVEDESSWQRRLARILQEVDCSVTIASNYEEAEDRLAAFNFDLATIDLNLDKSTQYADGLELILQVRKICGPQFPIIVITGTGDMEEQRRAFKDYNVYDFIQKARLDLDEFQTTIIEAIGSAQPS